MGRRRRYLWTAAGAAIVVAAAAGAWHFALREDATPASVGDALARYRAQAEQADTPIPPGVYVYATTGSEAISALGGRKHVYPTRSTITVTGGGCGMRLRWDALQHRSNTYDVCDDARRLAGWTEAHRFVGQDDVTRWRCTATAWLPAATDPGSRSSFDCSSGDSRQKGTTTVIGEEAIRVGGAEVGVVHLRLASRQSGASRGTTVEQRWLERQTGLPVRVEYTVTTINPSPIGEVRFDEHYDLRLVSLVPRR